MLTMARIGWRFRFLAGPAVALWAGAAHAGMRPHPQLTDLGKFRLDVISFFAVAILALALLVKFAWNALARDFAAMPRLSYGKSVGVVLLWGLLFVVVLAMISGARELMTPGAWQRREDGGYRLAGAQADPLEFARRRKLERLRDALWAYAKGHDGAFPPSELVPDVSPEAWESIHPSGANFVYVSGHKADAGRETVAFEPGVYGASRLALLSDGTIEARRPEEIRAELDRRGQR
jgi:hypothetical protein